MARLGRKIRSSRRNVNFEETNATGDIHTIAQILNRMRKPRDR